MRYIVNNSNDPFYNIALEYYAFKELLHIDEIFILWINSPAIIIGKHQNALEEINKEFVEENDIKLVRRISGGGAVYHDLNNLNYTIISSKLGGESFDFKSFSTPVINTLRSLGVEANFTGRNDIEIEGSKICGNAQAYINHRVMHHGCLLFDVDLSMLEKSLKISKDKIESKGIKSFRSRVTNIINKLPLPAKGEMQINVLDFKDLLLTHMISERKDMSELILTEQDVFKINEIKNNKFITWDWNYGSTPPYTIRRDTKYNTAKISIYINIVKNIIHDIKIYGDFFGIKDIEDIEQILIGKRYEYNDILDALNEINIEHYLLGINKKELAKAIAS